MQVQILDKRLKGLDFRPATPGSAGIDLHACIDEPISLIPGETKIISAGIKLAIPSGWAGIIVPRSGVGIKGLILSNTVGIIDSDYRGIINICLWNRKNLPFGERIKIKPLDRIAQLLVIPHYSHSCISVSTDELDKTKRNEDGFGSTGT